MEEKSRPCSIQPSDSPFVEASDSVPSKVEPQDEAYRRSSATVTERLVKPAQAPKRFKSSFIFFSMEKQKEVREQMKAEGSVVVKTITVAKVVAEAWKLMSVEERMKWEDMSRIDKARYEAEKSLYKGPWKVKADVGKRSRKDPSAPKRPMSAYLAFSNTRRGMVKQRMPHLGNADLSKTLSRMWKEAPHEVRQSYISMEATQRQAYKVAMVEWRKVDKQEKQAKRQERRRDNEAAQLVSDLTAAQLSVVDSCCCGTESLGFDERFEALRFSYLNNEYSNNVALMQQHHHHQATISSSQGFERYPTVAPSTVPTSHYQDEMMTSSSLAEGRVEEPEETSLLCSLLRSYSPKVYSLPTATNSNESTYYDGIASVGQQRRVRFQENSCRFPDSTTSLIQYDTDMNASAYLSVHQTRDYYNYPEPVRFPFRAYPITKSDIHF